MPEVNDNIVFFDGVCNLCNRFADFIIRKDRHHRLKVASLQGETANEKLAAGGQVMMESVVLYQDGRIYYRSQAVLRIFILLGGGWKLMGIFLVVPPFISDLVYGVIARNRYKWFGKRNTCRVPQEHEMSRFLP